MPDVVAFLLPLECEEGGRFRANWASTLSRKQIKKSVRVECKFKKNEFTFVGAG